MSQPIMMVIIFSVYFVCVCVSKFASRLECNTGRQEDCIADGGNVDDEA